MQVQVKQNGRIAKALVWLCCAAPCIGCSTDQSADTVPASDAAMPDAGHAEDAPNNSQDAQGTDHGGTGDTPQEDCPDGHVCGSGDTVACQGPVEFAADPQDEACTPAAHCPRGSVCGTGQVVACAPGQTFAADPIHTDCTPNTACPVPLCDIDGAMVCDASCIAGSFGLTGANSPTREQPWRKDADEDLVALGRQDAATITALASAPALMPAHPAHISVPGPLGDGADFSPHAVTVNATNAGRSNSYWYSNSGEPILVTTGVFAAPGQVFTVTVPEGLVTGPDTGLSIQVGTHTDRELVWNFPFDQPIRRFPEIVHFTPIRGRITSMNSAFGGMVYLRVDAGTLLGEIALDIHGAAQAPVYIHGVSDGAAWRDSLRDHPVPVAELVGEKIVLTVRPEDLEGIDPVQLMNFWTRAMDAVWYLAGIEPGGARVERIVADPAIEGIAHSGYPIHMAEKWAYALVDISEIRENQWWTTFHELGHNFQLREWTFLGLQEATCNLWALHVLETVGGVARADTHPDQEMSDAKRQQRIQTWVDEGRDFEGNWQEGFNAYQGFIPLEAFMQLQEAFGWELLHALNQTYRNLPMDEQPFAQSAKLQEWIVRSSQQAGVNLQGFYQDWGFPISEQTSATIGALPAWDENPMDRYD